MDKYIQRLIEAIEDGVENAANKTAKLLESENKRQAPVKTGRLRDSIYTSVKKGDYMAEVRAKAPYAGKVIRGSIYKGRKPNDFPQRAYNNKQNEALKIIHDEIQKALSKWR